MAGDKLYLGSILGQLKQDTQDYSNTLNQVITKLDNVRMAVEQSTTSLNVVPSEVLKFGGVNPLKKAGINGTAVQEVELYSFLVMCTGVIRVRGVTFSDYNINNTSVFAVTSSGARAESGIGVSTSQQAFTINVPVKSGDVVTIKAKGQMSGAAQGAFVSLVAASVMVYYSQIDIVNSSAIVGL